MPFFKSSLWLFKCHKFLAMFQRQAQLYLFTDEKKSHMKSLSTCSSVPWEARLGMKAWESPGRGSVNHLNTASAFMNKYLTWHKEMFPFIRFTTKRVACWNNGLFKGSVIERYIYSPKDDCVGGKGYRCVFLNINTYLGHPSRLISEAVRL